uniref:protein FAM184A-like n=1 Tax=Styela clava TaxID=7725 RepID=UPI0019395630|nr:protein FAM184A-like [Styela clava]
MASGGTSWQYYNNSSSKYPHMPPPNSQAAFGAAGGDMQDMHLKMSKKIAQLTKVIYALNTKNDEHESALLAMKEAHEEETQQLLSETAAKIQHYRLKIGNELDLRKKIHNLEEIINASEKEKRQAMIEFESFKRLVEEREMRIESDHTLKVMGLTKDLGDCKSEFEQRLRDFHDLKTTLRNEGGHEMEKMSNEHRKELERLHAIIDSKDTKFNNEKRDLIDSHTKQIHALERENTNLKQEFKKSEDEYESKMNKAKAFYERELAALRSQASATDEEAIKRWQERESEIRQEASKLEYSLKKKLAGLQDELQMQTHETEDLRKKLEDATTQITNITDQNSDLQTGITRVQKEYSNSCDKVQYLLEELNTLQSRLQNQEADILKKSSQIGTLEASKLTQEANIQGLEKEIKILKSQIDSLSSEKDSLQSNTSEKSQQLMEQLQVMGKRLESVMEEKSNLQKQFTKNLEQLKQSHSNEMKQLTEQYDNERQATERNNQSLIESLKTEAQNSMDAMLRDMQDRLRKETTQLNEEKNEAVSKVESEKKELYGKLQTTQNELSRLESLVRQHEDGLGDASSHIKNLNSRISELQREVEMSDGRLRTSETSMAALRKELESNKISFEQDMHSTERKHQNEIERFTTQLNSKWQEQMRSELGDLQTRLINQHTQDKRSSLEQLQSQKEREIKAAKLGWQEQIKHLTTMISELKSAMEELQKDSDRALAEEKSKFVQNERELRQAANDAATEYSSKIANMENAHRSEMTTLEHKKEEELRSLEGRLLSQYREEQQTQMQAHRLTIESIKEKLNREHEEELIRKEQEGLQDLEEMRSELTHQHAYAMDDAMRQFEQKLMSVRGELERALDATRRQESDYSRKISGLEDDLSQKTSLLNDLQQRAEKQGDEIISLNKEVDCKGQEILRIRSEANIELRRREDDLSRKFQREQDKMEAESLRQKQALVGEFNRATESLKDKISSLNIALQEAEDRFSRRESRPEDLRTIKELKQLVHDKEVQMQKLIDDKKYYQLELVNRETNFNKVFSTSPNVGVLNPLNVQQKKKGDKPPPVPSRFSSQYVSVPNLSSIESALSPPNRLGPLQNGSTSPSASSTSSTFSKNMRPTPPTQPKKFIRSRQEQLPQSQKVPSAEKKTSPLEIDDDFFPPSKTLSQYRPDDFEGSLQEFDKECELIETRSSLSSSCQSLNSLEEFKSPVRKATLQRSNTLPLNTSRNIPYRPASCNDGRLDDDDLFPNLDDIIENVWNRKDAVTRLRSSFSASLPSHYSRTASKIPSYATSVNFKLS